MLLQVSHPGILHRVWCTLRKVRLVLPSHQGGATAAAVEGEEGDSSANAEHHDAEVAKELEACQRRVSARVSRVRVSRARVPMSTRALCMHVHMRVYHARLHAPCVPCRARAARRHTRSCGAAGQSVQHR
jgi:hypothetical protein